ncbi:MAG TPA: DMT family transporter [Polyangiaceae bacterium]|jgi:drug/metabolite transporter (DMT)-like permease|nr:DMT family transporter [Polyangiaceae bacterium]
MNKSGNVITRDPEALLLAALAILGFSGTLPATRLAVPELGASFVGCGRAVVASLFAAVLLLKVKAPLPSRRDLPGLLAVALGVIIGFPLFTSLAARTLPASHAAVFTGLVPAVTTAMAMLRAGERPRPAFLAVAALGALSVVAFSLIVARGTLTTADVYLMVAILAVAVGYAEGGIIAKHLGGSRVIAWALLLVAPFMAIPVVTQVVRHGVHGSLQAWLGFAYVSGISMFAAFSAWYRSLALGGIARTSQLQLVQPVLTLLWCSLFLGEPLDAPTLTSGGMVVVCTALARRTRFANS